MVVSRETFSRYDLVSGPRLNRRSSMLMSEWKGILASNTWSYSGNIIPRVGTLGEKVLR